MNASDDEFEQYLNELNYIVLTVVLWITSITYYHWSELAVMDSRVTIQPGIKCIHQAYYCILFPPPDWILNHHLSPNFQRFWPFWSYATMILKLLFWNYQNIHDYMYALKKCP